jgi:DNA-binding transcriptional LysR family regulator
MAMLDLYKLQVFAQVAQAGSFSAAAEQLYMSQPAVSQHIQELEAALGVTLFQRGRRGVTLTIEGRVLNDYTERIFKLVAEAESEVLNVANLTSGQIRIGATPGVSTYLLPTWIHDFQEHYPKLVVSMHTATTPNIAAQLTARQLDVGFIEGELDQVMVSRIDGEVLCDVPQLVVVGPKHPFGARPSVALHELDGQAFIMRQAGSQTRIWLDHVLEANRAHPKVVAEFDNPEAIKRSIAAGLAAGILPAYAVRAEIQAGVLHALSTNIALSRALRVIWDKSVPLSPIARALLAFADACVHSVHDTRTTSAFGHWLNLPDFRDRVQLIRDLQNPRSHRG